MQAVLVVLLHPCMAYGLQLYLFGMLVLLICFSAIPYFETCAALHCIHTLLLYSPAMFRLKLPHKHTLEDILHSKLKVSVTQFQGNYFALNCNPSVYIVKPDMCWPHAWFLEI